MAPSGFPFERGETGRFTAHDFFDLRLQIEVRQKKPLKKVILLSSSKHFNELHPYKIFTEFMIITMKITQPPRIKWYLPSTIALLQFYQQRVIELRMCGCVSIIFIFFFWALSTCFMCVSQHLLDSSDVSPNHQLKFHEMTSPMGGPNSKTFA